MTTKQQQCALDLAEYAADKNYKTRTQKADYSFAARRLANYARLQHPQVPSFDFLQGYRAELLNRADGIALDVFVCSECYLGNKTNALILDAEYEEDSDNPIIAGLHICVTCNCEIYSLEKSQ